MSSLLGWMVPSKVLSSDEPLLLSRASDRCIVIGRNSVDYMYRQNYEIFLAVTCGKVKYLKLKTTWWFHNSAMKWRLLRFMLGILGLSGQNLQAQWYVYLRWGWIHRRTSLLSTNWRSSWTAWLSPSPNTRGPDALLGESIWGWTLPFRVTLSYTPLSWPSNRLMLTTLGEGKPLLKPADSLLIPSGNAVIDTPGNHVSSTIP